MPRQINQKCLLCSRLSREDAIAAYGNTCWDDKLCPSRRSRYASRDKTNLKRRYSRRKLQIEDALARGETPTEIDFVDFTDGLTASYAFIQIYRENADSPVHAIIVELWVDGHLRAKFPKHTLGLTTKQLNIYFKDVLDYINKKYNLNLSKYSGNSFFKPDRCHIRPCPLEPKPVQE